MQKEYASYFLFKLCLIQHGLLSFKCIKQVKGNLTLSYNAVVLKTSTEQRNSLPDVHKHYAALLHPEGRPLQQHTTHEQEQ